VNEPVQTALERSCAGSPWSRRAGTEVSDGFVAAYITAIIAYPKAHKTPVSRRVHSAAGP
jgi:hypothetical protein